MGKAVSVFAKIINGIKKGFKFLSNGLGLIVLYLIAIILLIILLYILGFVIGSFFADLLGIETPGADQYVHDAEFLQSLTNSGYDELIDAKQLMNYYAFEYATLMDAARYLEEVGTTAIAKEDGATINPRELSREQWLYLVAQAFGAGSSLDIGMPTVREEQDAAGTAPIPYTPAEEEPNTECSENDLMYFRTYNEYTDQECLMPYLCLTRMDDDLTFYFEVRNIAEEAEYKSKGKYNYQDKVNGNSSLGQEIAGKQLRFNEMEVGGKGADDVYAWLLAHVFPSKFNLLLNKGNKAAFAEGDARYDGLTMSSVDLMMDYDDEANMYYTTEEIEVPYKIPLRVLLDRFLPNATLLGAWRHLSDDEVLKQKMGDNIGENLVDELLKIYSEACLKDETMVPASKDVEEIISTDGETRTKSIQVASTNNETFAKFETTLLKSTTFREWRFAIEGMGRMSNEDWFVDDALEELESNIETILVTYDVTWPGIGTEYGHTHYFSPDELGGMIGVDYNSVDTKVKIADEMVLDYTVTQANFLEASETGTYIRRHDLDGGEGADHTAHDYSRPPLEQAALAQGVTRCDQESPNAMLDPETAAEFGWHGTGTSTGAMYGESSTGGSYIELSMKSLGVAPGAEFNTSQDVEVGEITQKAKSSGTLKSYLESIEPTKQKPVKDSEGRIVGYITVYPVVSVVSVVHKMSLNYCVCMPTSVAVSMLSQRVVDKTLPNGYFVKDANYWAADKRYNNTYVVCGEYFEEDRERFGFLIPNSSQGMGITDIRSNYNSPGYAKWRCQLFAPIFAGMTENDLDSGREADVEYILSEWETVANTGVNAADHAMRDLYYLINYSKGILSGDVELVNRTTEITDSDFVKNFEPLKQADGSRSLINVGSYTYLYLPDEILFFNPLTSEKIFWLDRIISTNDDRIDNENENKMRSRLLTFTWQIVDYDLYDETEAEAHGVSSTDGRHYVYAMWPFGDQMSRFMYCIDSNANSNGYDFVKSWGGYSEVHRAADLYGRAQAEKIYNSIYGEPTGEKEKIVFNEFYGYGYDRYTGGVSRVKAEASGGGVILTDANGKIYNDSGDEVDPTALAIEEKMEMEEKMLDTGTDSLTKKTAGPVKLMLGNKIYTFGGSASAAFGYELYRQALIEGDGKKAEQIVKDRLSKELQWTEVRAQVPGIVKSISYNAISGFMVTLQHSGYNTETGDPEYKTTYCHMKRYPLVQEGQYVGAGTVLGYEGTTGRSLGYHVHTSYAFEGAKEQDTPVRYLYPFFTPFFYEDQAVKAKEAAGSTDFLKSDYWSEVRTVFPYGQIIDDGLASTLVANKDHNGIRNDPNELAVDDEITKSVDVETVNGKKIIKIQNYTPQYPVLTDVNSLATEENAADLGRINTTGNITRDAGKSDWTQDLLTTDPDYVDNDFIKKVEGNDNRIKGLK